MSEKNVLEEGIDLYKAENYTAALTFFLSLPDETQADPVELAYYLGLCYSKLNRYDDALLYLEQVVTSSGQVTTDYQEERILQCRYLLGVIYCLSGRKKLADYELNNLLETGYRKAGVYSSLAFIEWENGDTDKCIEYYRKALEEDDTNPTALNGMGYVLACENRDLTNALSYCKKALDLSPDSAACLDSLGFVYFRMGLIGEAVKYYERALKIDSSNTIIMEHLKEAQRIQE